MKKSVGFVDIFKTKRKYSIIYADPPWGYSNKNLNGSAEKHYRTMNLKDIYNLPIQNISRDNCILFLWATYPFIHESLHLIDEWGFKYKTIAFQWIKRNKNKDSFFFGLGNWTRSNSECCLLATKGKMKRKDSSISQIVYSPIQKHSKKPSEVRDKIVRLVGNKSRIELFSREKTLGWDYWGDEVVDKR